MLKFNDKEYLLRVGNVLRLKKYKVIFKDKSIFNDSYLSLTIIDQTRYVQIKLNWKWLKFSKPTSISLMSSDILFLDEIEDAILESKRRDSQLDSRNKKLYSDLISILTHIKKEKIGVNFSVSDLISNPKYKDILSLYDFVLPVVGFELFNQKFLRVDAVAVGGKRAGGILLYNQIKKLLKMESYIGFGYLGRYDEQSRDLEKNTKVVKEENGRLGSFSKHLDIYDSQ